MPLGAFSQHGDQRSGFAGARAGPGEPRTMLDCQIPVSATSEGASVSAAMERIEAAEEAHCSLPCQHPTASLPGRRHPLLCGLWIVDCGLWIVDCGFRRDVAPSRMSRGEGPFGTTCQRDHKPCAVSRRKFHQTEALWLPHLSHQLIYLTFSSSSPSSSSKSPNPSSRF